MAFNFGAFVGGMSRQISENIETEKEFQRQKDFRLEMLAEEEATKMRLASAAERKEQRKRDKEQAGILKAVGFSDAKAAWIMKGGAAAVNQYVDYANAAAARGIDPDTMIASELFSTDQQDPRNEAAIAATLGVDRSFTNEAILRRDTDVMTSVLGEIKKPEKTKEYATLQAGYAGTFSLLQAAKEAKDQGEIDRLTGVLGEWEAQISKASEDSKNEPEWFSKDSRTRIVRDALTLARQDQQFAVDMDGVITSKLQGREGPAAVAKLNAAASIASTAAVADKVTDQRLLTQANNLRNEAYNTLDKFGQRVAYSQGKDEDIKAFSYFKSDINEIKTIEQELIKSNRGGFRVGDVVIVKEKDASGAVVNRIKVYTGIATRRVETSDGIILFDYFHDAGVYKSE